MNKNELTRSEASAPLARRGDGLPDLDNLLRLADLIGRSGLFACKGPEEVATKILWGAEAGLGPIASVQGIDVIQGSPSPSGGLIASLLDRHPRYAYHVLRTDDDCCLLAFYSGAIGEEGSPFIDGRHPSQEPWEGLKAGVTYRGTESFTMEDAKRAGLAGKGPWRTYPRAMLFNRAISEGRRTYAPALFGGAKGYTPEELGTAPSAEDLNPPQLATSRPAPSAPAQVVEADFTQTVAAAAETKEAEWLF